MFQKTLSHLANQKYSWTVTGAAGFIGSHLVEHLLRLNQKVVGLDNFVSGKKKNLEQVRDRVGPSWEHFRFIEGDIRDLETCKKAVADSQFVLHQAAIGSVPRSIETPIFSHENNVNGFLNVLTAVKEHKVKRLVFASSSAVYGDDVQLPKIESRIGVSQSPYAVTKLINELYAKNFSALYGVESVGLRYFNIFGPRQDPEGPYAAVIPKWVRAFCKNETVKIHGDGETSRDFCYINNVVQMNILSALTENRDAFNRVYNVALGERTTLNQLYQWLRELLVAHNPKLRATQPVYEDFKQGDIRHSQANITDAKNLLGYSPTHNIQEGLGESIDWYIENL